MHIYLFRLSMKDSIRHWHNLLMEQWIFDTSQRSLVLQPGGVLIAVYMTSLQGSFECSGWLNMSYVMRQRIPDRRRGMGKWTMSKYIGFYVRNAYRSWVRWGAELSWWRLDTEKVRQINRGCTREKGVTECWQHILNTCFNGQPVKSSEEGWNMISFMSFEDEFCSWVLDFL